MAIRNDIIVRWDLSPRLIIIDASSLEISMQDLIDTLRTLEATVEGIDEPYILNASGKEALGAGVTVGLTVELQNARIYFGQRTWVDASGTTTSADPTGTYLYDNTADFITSDIDEGNIAFNTTTGAMATVLTVASETLYTLPLTGGSRQTWEIGDSYSIYPNELCSTQGGNLVAIDASGNELYPILQSPNVQSTLTSSSAATSQNLEAIQYASYQNGVWLSSTGVAGTAYPIGTPLSPVNNMTDAHTIIVDNGFRNMYFITDWTFGSTASMTDHTLIGISPNLTKFTFARGSNMGESNIENATITGTVYDVTEFKNCIIQNLTIANLTTLHAIDDILLDRCFIDGTFSMDSSFSGSLSFTECYTSGLISDYPIYDLNNASVDIMFRSYSGGMGITNMTDAGADVTIDMISGRIILQNTNTAGSMAIRGVGLLSDDSSGLTINSDGFMNKSTVANAVYDVVGTEIEYSAFGAGVWVDACVGVPGTAYPSGSQQAPVNNLTDAEAIAVGRGFTTIYFLSDFLFDGSTNITNYELKGRGQQSTTFTIESGADLHGSEIYDAKLTGIGRGIDALIDCRLDDFTFEDRTTITERILIKNTIIAGVITFANNFIGNIQILDSWGMPDASQNPPTISINDSSAGLQIRNYSGFVKLADITNDIDVRVFLASGGVTLLPSITSGDFILTGTGILTDTATSYTSLNTDALISKDIIAQAVWDEPLLNHIDPESTGRTLLDLAYGGYIYIDTVDGSSGTVFPFGIREYPVNNLTDAITIATTYNGNNFQLAGELTLDQDVGGFEFHNNGNGKIHLNGQPCLATQFYDLKVDGSQNNVAIFERCRITNIQGIAGVYRSCYFLDSSIMSLSSSQIIMDNCRSQVAGNESPVFDASAGGIDLSMRAYSGGIKFLNYNDAANKATVEFIAGKLNLDSTDTAGLIAARGVYDINPNGANLSIVDTGAKAAGWKDDISGYVDASSAGYTLWNNAKSTFNKIFPFFFAK